MTRDAWFVDEVPGKKRNIAEARYYRRNERPLLAHSLRVQIWVIASQNLGQEGEEIELHRQLVFAGGHQVGFDRPQRSFVRLAVLVAELVPSRPPAGANHVES